MSTRGIRWLTRMLRRGRARSVSHPLPTGRSLILRTCCSAKHSPRSLTTCQRLCQHGTTEVTPGVSAGVMLPRVIPPASSRLASWRSGSVKTLSEPTIDRCQEVSGFGTPLLLPQACQAHGGAQLQGDFASWRRATSRARCNQESASRLRRPRLPQEQDAAQAMDFRFPVAFLMLLDQGVSLGQRLEAVCRVAQVCRLPASQGPRVMTASACPSTLPPPSPPGGGWPLFALLWGGF